MVADVVNDTSPELKMDVKTRFSIGPVVARDFWTKERSVMDIDRGPCKSIISHSIFLMLKFVQGTFHMHMR